MWQRDAIFGLNLPFCHDLFETKRTFTPESGLPLGVCIAQLEDGQSLIFDTAGDETTLSMTTLGHLKGDYSFEECCSATCESGTNVGENENICAAMIGDRYSCPTQSTECKLTGDSIAQFEFGRREIRCNGGFFQFLPVTLHHHLEGTIESKTVIKIFCIDADY